VRPGTLARVSRRREQSWNVLVSWETPGTERCVDLFSRPDGTYGFEEFRRDPEDRGAWTPIRSLSDQSYATEDDARAAARRAVPWLDDQLGSDRTDDPPG